MTPPARGPDLDKGTASAVAPAQDAAEAPTPDATHAGPLPPRATSAGPLSLDALLARLGLPPARALNVYPFGSRVYGTSHERSDWDFLIVTADDAPTEEHLVADDINAALHDRTTFARLLDGNSVWALESQFLPPAMVWKETLDLRGAFRIDPALLRRSVCAEAGYAWSKARRLIEREGDLYRGKKNLFHALRFLIFGAQLAREGRIVDYGAANHHLAALLPRVETDWRTYRSAVEGDFHRLRREFTALVPHEGRHLRHVEGPPADHEEVAPLPSPRHAAGPAATLATVRLALLHGLPAVAREHRLVLRRHREFPSLVQLSYTVEAPADSPVVAECRGLILDAADGYRVVAFPFPRFFNHGEPRAAALDWSAARVFEKIDGSLAILYWYAGRWRVASRSHPDGSGQLGWYSALGPLPFADLFWQLWEQLGYRLPEAPAEGTNPRCYLFEMATNRHQIVVRHGEDALVLHGARDLATLEELDPVQIAEEHGWKAPKIIPGAWAPAAVQALAAALDPLRAEGFVVCDGAFRRVKFKCPGYVRLSGAIHGGGRRPREDFSARRLVDLVRHGATGEFVVYFPEHAGRFRETQEAWDHLCRRATDTHASLARLPPAEFGRAVGEQRVLDRSWPRVLFALRRGVSAGDTLRQMPLSTVERLLARLGRP